MGIVFKAEDTRLGRLVALKFLSGRLAQNPQALARFQREARAASALDHPNICTIHDIGEYEGQPFIVMQYLEGQTLRQRMDRDPLGIGDLLDQGVQIGWALAAAHAKGIVHRDIKPSNVFIIGESQVKLLDFGLAVARLWTGQNVGIGFRRGTRFSSFRPDRSWYGHGDGCLHVS